MHPFLDYFIKANGLLLFFWLFYRLFLHKETFYTTNRWYLLGSIFISLIAPLITFTKTVFIEASKPTIDWDKLATIDTQNTIVEQNLFTIENIALISISIISTILVIKTLFQLAQTYLNIQKLPYDATLQVRRSSDETIFSLYPYIVVPNHFEEITNSEMILTHEQVHIQQKHSFDMILMQLIRSVFWMNPLLRYFQKDIEVNLEYIVDEHLQTQFDSKSYQLSLLSFHSTTPQPFVNSFNSQLKKRIVQINSKKSNPMKKLKMILAAPAIVAFFTLFQIETQAQITESLIVEEVTEDEKIEEDPFNIMIHPLYDDTYYERIEKMLNEKYHLEVKFSNLKRNEKGELIDYIITCKNNIPSTIGPFQPNSKNPINPFTLHIYKNKKGTYSLDLLSDKKEYSDIIIEDKTLEVQQTHSNNLGKKSSKTTPQTEYNEENNNDISKYILETKDEMIVTKDGNIVANNPNRVILKGESSKKFLYIVNGKEIKNEDFRTIQPDDIESITILKDKNAIDKYGAKGKDGVVEIITKSIKNFSKLKEIENKRQLIQQKKEEQNANLIKQRKEIENKRQLIQQKKEEQNANLIKQRKEIENKRLLIQQKKEEQNANLIKQKKEIENRRQLIQQKNEKQKLDVKVSVKLEKPQGTTDEDFALLENIFNAAQSAKDSERTNIKISSIKADLVTDKTKYSKKITYN